MLSPYVISYDELSKASSIISDSINAYYKEVVK